MKYLCREINDCARIFGTAVLGVLALSFVTVSYAQDETEDATEEAEAVLEEILVTGSCLRRDSFNVSTPLVILDSEIITDAGLGSLAEIMIDEIPALYESTSNMNSQSQIGNTGVTSANLRRLGSNRTLVLIDGRRTVQNAYGGKFVSLIPFQQEWLIALKRLRAGLQRPMVQMPFPVWSTSSLSKTK